MNGDGTPDVLLAGNTWDGGSWVETLEVILQHPTGSGALFGNQPILGAETIQTIAAGDLNGDGFTDLVVFRAQGPWEGWINTCGPGAVHAP